MFPFTKPHPKDKVIPQPAAPPPDPIEDLRRRATRIETRLVRLMAHHGLDADGDPLYEPEETRG